MGKRLYDNGVNLGTFQLYLSASYDHHPPLSLYFSPPVYLQYTKNILRSQILINQDAESHAKYN